MLGRAAIVVIGLAMLAGCASQPQQPLEPPQPSAPAAQRSVVLSRPLPGQYAAGEDYYKTSLNDAMQLNPKTAQILPQIRNRLIDCSWLAFQGQLTPEEDAAFEATARGEQDLPASITISIYQKALQTFSMLPGNPNSLTAYCQGFLMPPQIRPGEVRIFSGALP